MDELQQYFDLLRARAYSAVDDARDSIDIILEERALVDLRLRFLDEADNLSDYWEYYARKHRRLEIAFRRDLNGYLHGSIEELSEPQSDVCVGLLLHFDSHAEVGTDWDAAVLGHMDGEINVYLEKDAVARWGQPGTLSHSVCCGTCVQPDC